MPSFCFAASLSFASDAILISWASCTKNQMKITQPFCNIYFPKLLTFGERCGILCMSGEGNTHQTGRPGQSRKPQGVELVQAEQYGRPALRVAEVKARLLGERGKP